MSEVLITLVVIGVVTVITVPVCIDNYRKASVPAKLKKFYSVMNNAVTLYHVNEGEDISNYEFESSDIQNGTALKTFYDNTFGKYVIDMNKNYVSNNEYLNVIFNDGSGFVAYISTTNIVYFFYCTEFKYCGIEKYDGKTSFLFTLYLNKSKVVTSVSGCDNYTREQLLNSCKYGNYDNSSVSSTNRRHACARLIQVDGWQIKSDYPWKQSFL